MASLELNHVYKVYPNGVKAVNDFKMDAKDKEFIVFVGPSGCGKSTTLRMIAGLEEITSGDIKIDGQIVNDAEPKERDIAMVFQNYALYPHMTVYQNMAFGLKLRHMPKAEIDRRVREAARILGLTDYLNRKPKAMSGGQRQRVALGRAIVREPKIFLLDEPLSNLDAKLRASMRNEISKLHKKLQTTFVYVTHDQVEAMTMGTIIVVMKDGFVQQIDKPTNLYKYPANKFVAGFIGTPQMNFFDGTIERKGKKALLRVKDTKITWEVDINLLNKVDPKYMDGETEITFGVRCEHISSDPSKYPYKGEVKVNFLEELGVDSQLYASFDLSESDTIEDSGEKIIIKCPTGSKFEQGEVITVSFDLDNLHLFDKETEECINPRMPKEMSTSAEVKDGVLKIYGSEISLPKALELKEGRYEVTLPVSAIKQGKEVKVNILSEELINDKYLYVLGEKDNFIYLESENKLENEKTMHIDIDLKMCSFKGEEEVNALNLQNELPINIEKLVTKVEHFDENDKSYFLKEYCCAIKIKDSLFGTNKVVGQKLLNLKEKRIIKGKVLIKFTPYACSLSEEGIEGEITEIIDYGKEKFAKVRVQIDEKNVYDILTLANEHTLLGSTHLNIDVDNAEYILAKNGIKLA